MDTKKYEVLEKTVELSSLTKAAQELGLTQSGVSHMLAAIEAELQLPLLKRTRTGARLTPEGEQMMPYIHEIVRQEKLLRQAAAALHTLVTGKNPHRHVHERRHALAAGDDDAVPAGVSAGGFSAVQRRLPRYRHLARRRERRSGVHHAPRPPRLQLRTFI